MNETTTEPARISNVDAGFEDHGMFTLFATFDYGSSAQGLGYIVNDLEFIKRFLRACGVDTLQQCNGRIVMVTHDYSRIYRIDPMPFDRKRAEPFDIEQLRNEVQR